MSTLLLSSKDDVASEARMILSRSHCRWNFVVRWRDTGEAARKKKTKLTFRLRVCFKILAVHELETTKELRRKLLHHKMAKLQTLLRQMECT